MVNVSVARRYARALLEVAGETSRQDPVGAQLTTLVATMEKNRELTDVLADPAYTRAQRQAVMEAVMKLALVDESSLQNLLRLLVDRNRVVYLPDIARAYGAMADSRAGRVRAQVTSAQALDPAAVKRMEQALERLTQRSVVLESSVDPSLLGGVSAQVGSTVYDGSLRSQLEELHRELVAR